MSQVPGLSIFLFSDRSACPRHREQAQLFSCFCSENLLCLSGLMAIECFLDKRPSVSKTCSAFSLFLKPSMERSRWSHELILRCVFWKTWTWFQIFEINFHKTWLRMESWRTRIILSGGNSHHLIYLLFTYMRLLRRHNLLPWELLQMPRRQSLFPRILARLCKVLQTSWNDRWSRGWCDQETFIISRTVISSPSRSFLPALAVSGAHEFNPQSIAPFFFRYFQTVLWIANLVLFQPSQPSHLSNPSSLSCPGMAVKLHFHLHSPHSF